MAHQFISNPGSVWQSFEDIASWATDNTSTLAVDTVNVKTGRAGIRVSNVKPDTTYSTTATLKKAVNIDLSSADTITFRFFVHDLTKLVRVMLYISNTVNWTNDSLRIQLTKSGQIVDHGWNTVTVAIADMEVVGSGTISNPIRTIYLVVGAESGQLCEVTFDSIILGRAGEQVAVLTFDGAWSGVVSSALPAMESRGIKGNMFVEVNTIGDPGHTNDAGILQLHATGWYVGGHSVTHANPDTLNETEFKADVQGSIDYLKALGIADAGDHYAYPYGYPVKPEIRDWCADLGIKTARGTVQFRQDYDALDSERYRLRSTGLSSSTTTASIDALVGRAKRAGVLLNIYMHDVLPDAEVVLPTAMKLSVFTYMLDYLISEGFSVLTMPELWDMATDRARFIPRY
jgi:peptidoglycan/xylan/chitin deacetylase (PgdA/CDA1 family)